MLPEPEDRESERQGATNPTSCYKPTRLLLGWICITFTLEGLKVCEGFQSFQRDIYTSRRRDIYLKAQMATLLNPACFSSVLRRYAAVAEDVEVLRGPSRLQRRNHLARMSVTVPSTDSALTLTPELRQTISANSMESPHLASSSQPAPFAPPCTPTAPQCGRTSTVVHNTKAGDLGEDLDAGARRVELATAVVAAHNALNPGLQRKHSVLRALHTSAAGGPAEPSVEADALWYPAASLRIHVRRFGHVLIH